MCKRRNRNVSSVYIQYLENKIKEEEDRTMNRNGTQHSQIVEPQKRMQHKFKIN